MEEDGKAYRLRAPFRNECSKLRISSEAVTSDVSLRCSYVICFSVIFCKLLNQCSNQGSILRDGVAYREHQIEEGE